MNIMETEKETWSSLINEIALDGDYSDQVEEDCELLMQWFKCLTNEGRLRIVVEHIRRGLRLPWFYQDDPSFNHVFKDLMPMYTSPLRFTIGGEDTPPQSLSFRQFSALHSMFASLQVKVSAPMIRAYPEYWYLYQACRTPHHEIGLQLQSTQDPVQLGGIVEPLGLVEAAVYSDVLNIQDASKWVAGVVSAPRFVIPNDSYRITAALYAAWTNYWERILALPVLSFIGKKTCEAVNFVKVANGEVEPRSFLNARQDALVMVQTKGTTIYEMVVSKASVPVPYLTVNAPLAFDNVVRPMDATACMCHRCGSLAPDSALALVGERNFVEAMTEIPIVLTDIPDNIIGKNGMSSTDVDKGSEKLGQIANSNLWAVAVNRHLWNSYLAIDAILAKYANNSIYDRVLDEVAPMNIDLANTYFKNFGGGRPPRTFNKFAWIYWALNMVSLDAAGKYPVGRPKPLSPRKALEISGAPWGNMMALIEAGLVSTVAYTCFSGEAYNSPVYKADDKHGNRLIYDLLEGYEGPTDIKSITKAIHMEKSSKKPVLSKERFDLIVLDLPLHRNSSSMHSGKDYSRENKDRKLKEFCDDLPLGKRQAMREFLGYYRVIIERMLEPGGTLIIKVLEFWHKEVVDALWSLFSTFATVKIFRNPYSRVASKEVYFVGQIYESGGMLSKNVFYGSCMKMANHVISNLSVNLVRLAQKWGTDCLTNRQICCRRELSDMLCLPFTGTTNEYKVPRAPKRPQEITTHFYHVRTKVDPYHVESLRGLGYTSEEAIALLNYWGSERTVLAAPDEARKALLAFRQEIGDENKNWRVDSDTASLIAKLSGSSFERALTALALSKGDLVMAISDLNMGA